MTVDVGELLVFVALAAAVGIAGLALGIVFLAPRISRLLDRTDEDPGARDD